MPNKILDKVPKFQSKIRSCSKVTNKNMVGRGTVFFRLLNDQVSNILVYKTINNNTNIYLSNSQLVRLYFSGNNVEFGIVFFTSFT